MRQPLDWQIASVKDIRPETANVKTFTLALPNWTAHRAGQHYDIRLTARGWLPGPAQLLDRLRA